jgi:hypothetical protein
MNYKTMTLIIVLVVAMNVFAQEAEIVHEEKPMHVEEFGEIKYEIPGEIDMELEELRKKTAIREEVPGPVAAPKGQVAVPAPAIDQGETASQGETHSEAGGGETTSEQEKTAQEAEKAINN